MMSHKLMNLYYSTVCLGSVYAVTFALGKATAGD